MKKIKLKTDVTITYNKKGNIKTITTPYDNSIFMQPIHSIGTENELALRYIFMAWGNDFLINQNN